MINTKGENSLFNILYEKGLILTIEADFCHNLRSFTEFYVNIQLTDEGLEKLEEVLKLFSNYLFFINEEGIQEWIFEEIKRMNELKFYFKIKEKPLGYVESLA
jgi:nardilysin